MNANATVHTFAALWEASHHRGWLSFEHDGTVNLHGAQTGRIHAVDLQEVRGLGWLLTMHEAGHDYWSGRGSRGHAPASYRVVLVEPTADHMRYVWLTDFEPYGNAKARAAKSIGLRDRLHSIGGA